ncbi:uncharacterized protein LOC119648436 [Hermetia illucens]|uniref:uncharacterized protein LOC119648436 n=1 Tax=Hermetia illucens TaxID=343691 RepID=UPI0018CC711F|nr:uncharacterized protein LOC119648436 [Hermetia illucens]
MNSLSSSKHDHDPLPSDISSAIKPIYEELSKEELLERSVGGFTQNNNESLNQLIWKITPKILPAGSKILDIAAYVAAGTFHEGIAALLLLMHSMDLKLGRNSHQYERKEDESRILAAQKKLTLRLEKQEFVTDKSRWILPLQQALYYMVLESMTPYESVMSYPDYAKRTFFEESQGMTCQRLNFQYFSMKISQTTYEIYIFCMVY